MNKIFFIISIIIYILSGYISDVFDLDTNNTLWSGISFIILLIPLSIGCIVNSKIYKDKNSAWRFIFYYLSFMFSFGILLIAIITSFILKNVKECKKALFFVKIDCNIFIIEFYNKERQRKPPSPHE